MEEGQLPIVADATKLFNKTWSLTTRQSVIRCWLKSEIIGVNQQNQLRSILNGISNTSNDFDIELTGGNAYNSSTSLDDSEIIGSTMVKNIEEAIQAYKFNYQGPNSPTASTIEEAIGSDPQLKDSTDISAVLLSPLPYDDEPVRYNIQGTELLEMFLEFKYGMSSELQATNAESEGQNQQRTQDQECDRRCSIVGNVIRDGTTTSGARIRK